MSFERLKATEENIQQIRESVGNLRIEEARQTERLSSIRDALSRHDGQFSSIQSQFQEVSKTLNSNTSTIQEISKTLAVNTESLKLHMKRTDHLENRVSPLEKFHWKLVGGAAVVSIIGGFVAAIVLKLLN